MLYCELSRRQDRFSELMEFTTRAFTTAKLLFSNSVSRELIAMGQVQGSLVDTNEQMSGLMARVNELCRTLKEAVGRDEGC